MDARTQKLMQLSKEVELAAEALAEQRVKEDRQKGFVEDARRALGTRLYELQKFANATPPAAEVTT